MKTHTGVMVSAQKTVQHIEVRALWGVNVLSVTRITPQRNFIIGDSLELGEAAQASSDMRVDCTVPARELGPYRTELIAVRGGQAFVVLLPCMTGVVALPGQDLRRLSQCMTGPLALPLQACLPVDLRGDFLSMMQMTPAAPRVCSALFA